MAAPVIQFKRGLLTNLPGLRAGEPGFTTDSYDLYVGIDSTTANNQFVGSGRYWSVNSSTVGSGVNLVEGTDNGASFITLKAPDSLSGIVTYTMPGTDGSNNQVLATNGSGTLSFIDAVATLTVGADSGSDDTVNLLTDTLTFTGGEGIDTTVSDNTITIAGEDASDSNKGIASFDNGDFSVSSGNVTLADSASGAVLTIAGTAAEVNVSRSNGTVTVGLPDDVTVAGILTVTSSLDVNGATHDIAGVVELDNINVATAATVATAAITNATITNTTFGSGTAITSVDTDLAAVSASDDTLASAKAIKAYVDSQVTAQDLDFQADSGGALSIDLDSETLTIAGTANEIETSGSGNTVTIGLPSAVTVTTSVTTPTVQATNLRANDGTTAITIADSTGAVTCGQNLTVSGNLYVNGSTTQVNTSTTTIEDQLLDLGFVDGSAPSSDLNKDIGVLFNYYTSSAKKAAVYWDDSTSRIVVSQDVTESSGVLTNNTGGALEVASLYVNGCSGTTDQVIGCDGSTIVITNATIDGGSF